jgi:hypothetical protein
VAAEISVVIVTWNSGDTLVQCLQSLAESSPSVNWEAIVIDNGSTDDSIARVRTELPWVRVIANRFNRGLAAANNQGIAASQAPFVLISNPDVIYPAGAVDALVDLLRRRDRAAFAVANLRYADGERQTSVGALPSVADALLGRRLSRHWPGGERNGMWWHAWPHDEELPVGHGAEACYLVRRGAIAEVGLQNERFVLDWEGLDWSARMRDAGWEVWFCPAATVTHLEGTSRLQVQRRRIIGSHRGMYLYFRERTHPVVRPLLATAVVVRAAVSLALTGLSRRTRRETHAPPQQA